MNNNINNTTGRQVTRDFLVKNNLLEQLKETKDKDKEKREAAITSSSSEIDKQNDSIESFDSDDSIELFVSDKSGDKDENVVEEKELTVLFYLKAGPDRTSEYLARQIVDMESIGSTEDINLVAQLDRRIHQETDRELLIDNGWESIRRYYITRNDDPEFEEITIDKLLDLAKEHPGNAHFDKAIAHKYSNLGDKKAARKYWNRYKEAKDAMPKDKFNEYGRTYVSVIEEEFGCFETFTANLDSFERAGVNYISSDVLEEIPNGEYKDWTGTTSLQDFIEWGITNYPAKNYILVTGGHGSASAGVVGMKPSEMKEALTDGVKNANKETGRNDSIDAIVFNSCYMGSLEVATELKDNADFIISSQEKVGMGVNFKWDDVISEAQNNIDEKQKFDIREFADDYVQHFKIDDDDIGDVLNNKGYATVSVVKTDEIPDLLESFNNLLEICSNDETTEQLVFKAASESHGCLGSGSADYIQNKEHLKDFGDFLKRLQNTETLPESVRNAAEDVMEKLEKTVISRWNIKESDRPGYHEDGEQSGLHIWAPPDAVHFDAYSIYQKDNVPEFIGASLWSETLERAVNRFSEENRAEIMVEETRD
jgi:hypothetical protein